MKKWFVLVSNVLMSVFFVWVFTVWSDTYVSFYYPSVSVFSSSTEATFESLADSLSILAEETDSLLAMQHQTPGEEGATVFSYTLFGQGDLPEDLVETSYEEVTGANLATNYFLFSGNARIEQVREALSQTGLTNLTINRPSYLSVLVSVFSNGFQFLALLIFLLTFGALSLISQVLNLRTAGIRLISGEYRWKIFLRPLAQDVFYAAIGWGLGLVFAIVLRQFLPFSLVSFQTLVAGLALYNALLLFIAFFFASLFATGIHKVPLMQVIKGQIPIRGIISLILIGQFLALVIVSIGLNSTSIYSMAWQQQMQGQKAWQEERQLVSLIMGRGGADPSEGEEVGRKQQVWLRLLERAVSEDWGFLSHHHLIERTMQNGMGSSDNLSSSTEWLDYQPEGNVLIVTPQYLRRQQVQLTDEIDDKIHHLTRGEFVLLLPESLRSEADYYRSVFEEDISARMSSPNQRQEMVATVAYLESGQDRFVYNTTPISYQQFLRDPILVVLTPQSTGEQSYSYWHSIVDTYFLFDDVTAAQLLIEQYGIENWVTEIQSGYHHYQLLLDNLKREVWMMTAGAVLGSVTSILLFHTMNQLYFEEFRRDIFIKRINGLSFWEIHKKYLLAQILVFFLGFLVSIFFATGILTAFLVLLLFIGIAVVQLQFQMRKENNMSMIILKGA